MMKSKSLISSGILCALLAAAPAIAQAQPPDDAAAGDSPDTGADATEEVPPAVRQARESFAKGAEQVREGRWAEALISFERSAHLVPHPITSYNIGVCLRGMGHYVRAKKALEEARAADSSDTPLGVTLRKESNAMVVQIDGLVARATVRLKPAAVAVAVDGRPLEVTRSGAKPLLLAGTMPPGKGTKPPSSTFEVVLDPGARVFTLSRPGYADAVVNRTFAPGEHAKLDLVLEKLPATLSIGANQDDAVVAVDGLDVGAAPVSVQRREGSHRIVVRKEGFVPYETSVSLAAGESVNINATLPEDTPGIHERWWFWSAIGVTLTAVAVTTYFLAQPEPERPPPDGGGFGWVVTLP
jgi:hypothetical protein